jgi:glycosyltransferase involved in cell wall biosynthesis
MSIGMTNQQWEENRVEFAETFKNELPVDIKRQLRKDEKINVLLGCLNFNHFTGSELYIYELAKTLIKLNCNVSICSNIGEPLASMAKKLGIKLYGLNEPPGFKLGDGKWMLKGAQGEVLSQPNHLYRLSEERFDVIHLNHKPVTEHLLRLYPDTPVICSIHSEVISLEEPITSPQIKKYVAIRPEIKDYIVNEFSIDSESVEVIYNPFDTTRFRIIPSTKKREKKRVLFVGTIDYLRKNTIQDLINTTKANNQELWIVGKKNDIYLNGMIANEQHVSYFEPTFNIEKYIQECDETAGILLGRTTIEGWLCGKNGWIYDVDSTGTILSKKLHEVPTDLDKFNNENITKQIIEIYKNILE